METKRRRKYKMAYPTLKSMNNDADIQRREAAPAPAQQPNPLGGAHATAIFATTEPSVVYTPNQQPSPSVISYPGTLRTNGTNGTGSTDLKKACSEPTGLDPVYPAQTVTNPPLQIVFTNDNPNADMLEREKKLTRSIKWELRKKRLSCCCFFCMILVLIPWAIWMAVHDILIANLALPVCVHEDRTKCNSCFDKVDNTAGEKFLDSFHNVTEDDIKDGDWFEVRDMENIFAGEHWEFATAARLSHALRKKGHHPRRKHHHDDEDDHRNDEAEDEAEDDYRRLQAAHEGNLRALRGKGKKHHRGMKPTGKRNSTTEPDYTDLEYEADLYFRPGSYESCMAGSGPMTKKFLIESKNVSKLCY